MINIANILIIVLMMCYIVYMSYIVSGMKYSYWYIFMRCIRHKDHKPLEWLISNKYLFTVPPLMISVFIIILAYLKQLKDGLILVRPEIAVFSAVVFWFCLIYYNKNRDDKLRKYEKDNKL